MHNIIAYGSLICHSSLQRTVPAKEFKQVIVKGYKRVFNLATRYDDAPNVLNIVKDPDHSFNGVMFQVNDEELKLLAKREAYYNIEVTDAFDFSSGEKIGQGFVFVDVYIEIDKDGRNPFKQYFVMCREAAYNLSKDFGKRWDETTFTSRGEKISKWIKNNPDYDTVEIK